MQSAAMGSSDGDGWEGIVVRLIDLANLFSYRHLRIHGLLPSVQLAKQLLSSRRFSLPPHDKGTHQVPIRSISSHGVWLIGPITMRRYPMTLDIGYDE